MAVQLGSREGEEEDFSKNIMTLLIAPVLFGCLSLQQECKERAESVELESMRREIQETIEQGRQTLASSFEVLKGIATTH